MRSPRTTPRVAPEAAELEATVRRVVREELRAMLGRALDEGPRDYSSRRGHGPPGYAERIWAHIAKQIGVRRGRWWVVTRAQLEAYEAQQAGESTPAPVVVNRDSKPANDSAASTWKPGDGLAAIGLRRTR